MTSWITLCYIKFRDLKKFFFVKKFTFKGEGGGGLSTPIWKKFTFRIIIFWHSSLSVSVLCRTWQKSKVAISKTLEIVESTN